MAFVKNWTTTMEHVPSQQTKYLPRLPFDGNVTGSLAVRWRCDMANTAWHNSCCYYRITNVTLRGHIR